MSGGEAEIVRLTNRLRAVTQLLDETQGVSSDRADIIDELRREIRGCEGWKVGYHDGQRLLTWVYPETQAKAAFNVLADLLAEGVIEGIVSLHGEDGEMSNCRTGEAGDELMRNICAERGWNPLTVGEKMMVTLPSGMYEITRLTEE